MDSDELDRKIEGLKGKTRPTYYHDAQLWDAIHSGKAPTMLYGTYSVPTEYHARMEYYRKFKK